MPERTWPPIPRAVNRITWAVIYTCIAAAGAGVIIWPSDSLYADMGSVWVTVVGSLTVAFASAAAVSVIRWRWLTEWVAVIGAGMLIATYTVLEWFLVAELGWTHLGSGFVLTALSGALLVRAVELYVFKRQHTDHLYRRRRSTDGGG